MSICATLTLSHYRASVLCTVGRLRVVRMVVSLTVCKDVTQRPLSKVRCVPSPRKKKAAELVDSISTDLSCLAYPPPGRVQSCFLGRSAGSFPEQRLVIEPTKLGDYANRVTSSNRPKFVNCRVLRTFALIVFAHPYCARKSTCHVMPRHASSARAKY